MHSLLFAQENTIVNYYVEIQTLGTPHHHISEPEYWVCANKTWTHSNVDVTSVHDSSILCMPSIMIYSAIKNMFKNLFSSYGSTHDNLGDIFDYRNCIRTLAWIQWIPSQCEVSIWIFVCSVESHRCNHRRDRGKSTGHGFEMFSKSIIHCGIFRIWRLVQYMIYQFKRWVQLAMKEYQEM